MRRKVTWIERREIYVNGHRCYGAANHETFEIEIDTPFHRSPRKILNTETHELLHLIRPDLPEKEVRKIADFVSAELWRRSYRR